MERSKAAFNEYDYLFKFILVGAAGVGKTSIVSQYCENNFQNSYSPTLGVDFRIKTINIGEKVVKLQIWDTAGQERYSQISAVYFRGCHGCIFVYDLTDPKSLTYSESYLNKASTDYGIPEGNSLLVGNKSDLKYDRKVSRDVGLEVARKFNAGYVEASAKTADQIEEVFSSLAEVLIEKHQKGELTIDAVPNQKKTIIRGNNIEIRKSKNEFHVKNQQDQQCCFY